MRAGFGRARPRSASPCHGASAGTVHAQSLQCKHKLALSWRAFVSSGILLLKRIRKGCPCCRQPAPLSTRVKHFALRVGSACRGAMAFPLRHGDADRGRARPHPAIFNKLRTCRAWQSCEIFGSRLEFLKNLLKVSKCLKNLLNIWGRPGDFLKNISDISDCSKNLLNMWIQPVGF